jgi:hypothetical protein
MPRVLLVVLGLTIVFFERALAQQEGPKDGPIPPEQLAFFEKKIRPVLTANCYQCHSAQAEKIKGKLVLDTREGIRKGGESGPAVVPSNLKESLLIQAIRYHDESLRMPPKQKLPDAVVADFEQWVKMGAPDPRDGPAAKVAWPEIDIKKGKQFWAFQAPRKAAVPAVSVTAWPRGPIDQFLLAAMEAGGVHPVGDAERGPLLRRVYLDLIGLPPTSEELAAFLGDKSDEALAKVVDRLLASPHYGERWGRHWLDVARYGESSGKQVNVNYPQAWRYRAWVIAAFNSDKPYDRFIKEQIAGDLMPSANPKQKAEQLIATGYLALGPKDHNERNPAQFVMDVVDEQIEATSQAFLGLTVACARCHDHKFDPIPMKDYYSLAGIFKSTQPMHGTIRLVQNFHFTPYIVLPADSGQPMVGEVLSAAQRAKFKQQLTDLGKERAALLKTGPLGQTKEGQFNIVATSKLEAALANHDEDGRPKLLAVGVRDYNFPRDCPLYIRGEVDKPGPPVSRGFLQVITERQPVIVRQSGRLELAEWLASRDNPLTARVMVNRIWLHLFGRGLVATPDNFGAAGQPPSHPQLLDYLAVTFLEQDGWSVKKLIRRVVLSRAYQLASQHDARNFEIDPDNVLVWRAAKRRLDAEVIRDSILAIAGTLDTSPLKGSVATKVGEGQAIAVQRAPLDAKFLNRSVYLPIVRNGVYDMLALFDFADPSLVTGQRAVTTVPAQALFFLNSPWLIRQADMAAGRLLASNLSERERIQEAYLRCYARPATAQDIQAAQAFLQRYAQTSAGNQAPTGQQRRQAWTALCQAFFGSAEFLHCN